MEAVWALAADKLKRKAKLRKDRHDPHHVGLELNVGDSVLVRTHPLSSADDATIKKFFVLYEGPFFVSRIVGSNSYELANADGKVQGIHNIINLKKYRNISNKLL